MYDAQFNASTLFHENSTTHWTWFVTDPSDENRYNS